jgi:LuxR family transcriptional regulator, quorum-sensing system regulator SdiA
MKAHITLDQLSKIRELKSKDAIIVELEHLLIHYNFYYFGLYATMTSKGTRAYEPMAERWPVGWMDHYRKNNFEEYDPTNRFIHQCQIGFRWRDAINAFKADPQRKKIERFVSDARKYGLEDGYVFPIHGRNGLLGKLVLSGRPVELSNREMALFDTLAKAMHWQIRLFSDNENEALSLPDNEVSLTKRELQTLRLLAEGMTSIEIGVQMKISNHTVDWYMNGLQTKLKAHNRQHAVARGFRLGLIS